MDEGDGVLTVEEMVAIIWFGLVTESYEAMPQRYVMGMGVPDGI